MFNSDIQTGYPQDALTANSTGTTMFMSRLEPGAITYSSHAFVPPGAMQSLKRLPDWQDNASAHCDSESPRVREQEGRCLRLNV